MADAIAKAKFWIMPRTGTALVPVDSTATGVTATVAVALAVPVQAQVDCADWNSKEYSGRRWLRI